MEFTNLENDETFNHFMKPKKFDCLECKEKKQKKPFHPSLERVMKDLDSIVPYEIILYVYHTLNGRIEEGLSYLQTYQDEQEMMKNDFAEIKI